MKKYFAEFTFCNYDDFKIVREAIRAILQRLQEGQQSLLEVAVNEAVNNALFHGKANSKLRIGIIGRRVVIRLKKDGDCFPGNEILSRELSFDAMLDHESGRGLGIIQKAVDCVKYNKIGNELLMVKEVRTSLSS